MKNWGIWGCIVFAVGCSGTVDEGQSTVGGEAGASGAPAMTLPSAGAPSSAGAASSAGAPSAGAPAAAGASGAPGGSAALCPAVISRTYAIIRADVPANLGDLDGLAFNVCRNDECYSGTIDADGRGAVSGLSEYWPWITVSMHEDSGALGGAFLNWGRLPDPATDYTVIDEYRFTVTPVGASEAVEVFTVETGYQRTKFSAVGPIDPEKCGTWGTADIDLRSGD